MDRTLSVPGYVNISFADVLGAFSDEATISRLLDGAVRGAFPVGSVVRLQITPPESLTRLSARVNVEWQLTDPRGRHFAGHATIRLLVLQSGADPVTELLVTTRIEATYARPMANAVRRFLDELAARLAGVSTR